MSARRRVVTYLYRWHPNPTGLTAYTPLWARLTLFMLYPSCILDLSPGLSSSPPAITHPPFRGYIRPPSRRVRTWTGRETGAPIPSIVMIFPAKTLSCCRWPCRRAVTLTGRETGARVPSLAMTLSTTMLSCCRPPCRRMEALTGRTAGARVP